MASQRTQIVVRLLLINAEGQYLCLKQKGSNSNGLTLPGGRVEAEEFATEGLIREVLEEIGVQVHQNDLELVHVCHKKELLSKLIVLVFRASIWTGEIENKEPQKFKGIKWISPTSVPEKLPDILRSILLNVRLRIYFSEYSSRPSQVE